MKVSDIAETGTYDVRFASADSSQLIHSKYALSNADGTVSVEPSVKAGTIEISQQCEDTDSDDLCDSWESKFFGNLDQSKIGDYDEDGYSNEQEESGGTDPTIKPGEHGDLSNDNKITLEDGIIALKVSCSINSDNFSLIADINGDAKIGLEEAIFILQKVSGIR
ncbi:MAG: hypothetical protein GY749_24600 [Desulfobacteraceae bacterium]|nr:hypothetical protein [Desulfobacteraceae bacterium]